MSRGAETKAKMIQVAGDYFADKGYEGAHLEDIAREVGVRKTALYYYFENKEALYVAVLEELLAEFERVLSTGRAESDPKDVRLRRAITALNDVMAEQPKFARILIRVFVDQIQIDITRIRPYVARVITQAREFFAEAAGEGALRDLDPIHTFLSLLGASIFFYAGGGVSAQLVGVDDIYDPAAARVRCDQVVELLCHGLLAGGSKPSS